MKSKVIFVARVIVDLKKDVANTLGILISLQSDEIIAVAPYLNSYIHEELGKSDPRNAEGAQEISRRYLLDNFCDEMWLYGNSMDNNLIELIALTKKIGRVPVLAKTPEMKLLLEGLTKRFPGEDK